MCTEFICHMKETGTLQTETLTICGYRVPCASQLKNPEAKCIGCGLIKYIYIYMKFLDEFEIRFTCNLIFIFNFFLGRLWVCDLNTYHSHGKEGANKRHHQACGGAEKEKPLSINDKADVGFFYVQIIAEEMMNFSYSLFHKQTGCASKNWQCIRNSILCESGQPDRLWVHKLLAITLQPSFLLATY